PRRGALRSFVVLLRRGGRALLLVLLRAGRRLAREQLDVLDLEPRQLRAVSAAALVAALRLELEDVQLLAALVTRDDRIDLDLRELIALEHGRVLPVPGQEQRLERNLRALVVGHAIDDERVALLDAVLLAAYFHDRVHGRKRAPSGRAPEGQSSGDQAGRSGAADPGSPSWKSSTSPSIPFRERAGRGAHP